MSKNYPPMVQNLEKSDPALFANVTGLFDLVLSPGELDVKTKILITMTVDAFAGSTEGVKSLSKVARGMGVSDAQITEALRIAYMVAGNLTLGAIGAATE